MSSIFEYSQADHIDFSGKNFVLTGFGKVDEDRITEEIRERGGNVKSSLVKATDYLIVMENYDHQTVKYTKARQLQAEGRPVVILASSRYEALKDGASGTEVSAPTQHPETKLEPVKAKTAPRKKKAAPAKPQPEYEITPWEELQPKKDPADSQSGEQDAPVSDSCLDSFVRLDVYNPAVRDILLALGLSIEFFSGLCGAEDKPFGSCQGGSDSLFDLHFHKSLALTLAEITERLILLADCGADNTANLSEQMAAIRQLPVQLREHSTEIDSFGFVTAHLEKGFAGGPDGTEYEEYIYGKEGSSLTASADNKNVFSCTSCAEQAWFVTAEEFKKAKFFAASRKEFSKDDLYSDARDKYFDELLMGQHPDFFEQYDTPANRYLRFLMELPGEAPAGDMIDGNSLGLLRSWAQRCGRQQTYKR